MTAPEALRVATPLGSASKVGSASARPSGRARVCIRSYVASTSAEAPSRQVANSLLPGGLLLLAARDQGAGLRHDVLGTSKCCSGSKPRIFLVAATSSAPSAEPWEAPVPCAWGAGQAMTVRSTIRLGWSVTSAALRTASCSWGTSSV